MMITKKKFIFVFIVIFGTCCNKGYCSSDFIDSQSLQFIIQDQKGSEIIENLRNSSKDFEIRYDSSIIKEDTTDLNPRQIDTNESILNGLQELKKHLNSSIKKIELISESSSKVENKMDECLAIIDTLGNAIDTLLQRVNESDEKVEEYKIHTYFAFFPAEILAEEQNSEHKKFAWGIYINTLFLNRTYLTFSFLPKNPDTWIVGAAYEVVIKNTPFSIQIGSNLHTRESKTNLGIDITLFSHFRLFNTINIGFAAKMLTIFSPIHKTNRVSAEKTFIGIGMFCAL